MCGIVSVVSQKPIQVEGLQKSLNRIQHRGPDGNGVWLSPNKQVALGHSRLSIIDINTGAQPLFNEDKSIIAVVNGEFYDYENIRADLKIKGHTFETNSDSEILMHLYAEYGRDCVEHLRGEFAFVLWDNKKQLLFAGRDRFGIKPLNFHTAANGDLLIASEAKALFEMGVEAVWDEYAFMHAASMQYQPQGSTFFKGIHQLKPGHTLSFQNGTLNIHKYWDIDFPKDNEQVQGNNLIENFKQKFEEAVTLRMRSDVPICCHLSGGLDSSAVLGTVNKYSDKPVDCFTVSFDADVYDELEIAKETVKYLGAKHHVVDVSSRDIIDEMANAVYFSEGLAINGHLSAKYVLSRKIRDAGFKVALGGEGADEALAGYSHLRNDIFKANNVSQEELKDFFNNNPVTAGIHLAHGESLPLNAIQNALGYIPSFMEAKGAMGNKFNQILSSEIKHDYFADLMNDFDVKGQLKGRNHVDQSSYLWSKLTLANYILKTLGDGTEMAHSIEGRVPFLDHKLFEFCSKLPLNMKIKGQTEKYILREAAKDVLTDTVHKRQKQAFMAPPVSRFSSSLMFDYMNDVLSSEKFKTFPFIDYKKVKSLMSRLKGMDSKEQSAYEPILMMTLTAALMHEKFNMRG